MTLRQAFSRCCNAPGSRWFGSRRADLVGDLEMWRRVMLRYRAMFGASMLEEE